MYGDNKMQRVGAQAKPRCTLGLKLVNKYEE